MKNSSQETIDFSSNGKLYEAKRKLRFFWMRIVWYFKKYKKHIAIIFIMIFASAYVLWGNSPRNFPVGVVINIENGSTLTQAADLLVEKNIIKSSSLFKGIMFLRSGDDGVIAGDYFFHKPENIFSISRIISRGEYGLVPLSITIPEGSTVVDMAVIYERILGGFDAEHFVDIALPLEGYLFPDTYFFLPNVKEEEIVRVMKENFIDKVAEIQDQIDDFGKPLEDIVIMASLLEKEARTTKTRRTVAGILWNRIDIGMMLQVDAVFPYIIGKNTFQLSLKDLKYDSPYNTYKYKGLPFGPIANPGLRSLLAAVTPIETDYLFYLSDLGGNMHYARTFMEHKANKIRYLN